MERMAGGVFSGSADGSSWTTLYTVPDTIYEGENVPETVKWYEADVSGKYRYIKYENARQMCIRDRGKLGLITLWGRNLFETLMLNLVIPADREDAEVNRQTPSWERERYIPDDAEDVCIERVERVRIVQPDNLAELYTLQSRRILLERNEDGITGCSLLGGEFFERENAFIEPMTVWRDSGNKKKDIYTPRRHDPSKQFWREFASVYPESDTTHRLSLIHICGEKSAECQGRRS